MKKLTIFLAFLAIFALSGRSLHAQELTADASAALKLKNEAVEFDFRVENLKNYLTKFGSPLAEYAYEFVRNADKNGLDYRLVPAITGVESTFGKHIPYSSYNAYGWANGDYKFTSWENSIMHVSQVLKEKYIEKGAPTVSKIARRYAPPSSTWGRNVKYFIAKIDSLPLDFDII